VLSNRTLGSCTGCFQCWLKTPGLCVIDDDGRLLAGKFIQSDLVVLLTPVTFGVIYGNNDIRDSERFSFIITKQVFYGHFSVLSGAIQV